MCGGDKVKSILVMKLMLMDIMDYTTSDGPGFRTSVYCSGCNHACKGCQNPQTWNILNGKPTEVKEIFEHIAANDLANVTFSGGDPFYQPKAFSELARMIKFNTDKDIWCYTGFTIEEIFKDENLMELLRWVDVLVDGRFEEDKKDPDLLFRGSSNQRLIDVKKTLKTDEIVLYDYEPFVELPEEEEVFI